MSMQFPQGPSIEVGDDESGWLPATYAHTNDETGNHIVMCHDLSYFMLSAPPSKVRLRVALAIPAAHAPVDGPAREDS